MHLIITESNWLAMVYVCLYVHKHTCVCVCVLILSHKDINPIGSHPYDLTVLNTFLKALFPNRVILRCWGIEF